MYALKHNKVAHSNFINPRFVSQSLLMSLSDVSSGFAITVIQFTDKSQIGALTSFAAFNKSLKLQKKEQTGVKPAILRFEWLEITDRKPDADSIYGFVPAAAAAFVRSLMNCLVVLSAGLESQIKYLLFRAE